MPAPAKNASDDSTAAEAGVLREWELPELLSGYLTERFFPVSPRTLSELWPVKNIVVNKRRLLHTAETIAHARTMMDTAISRAVRGGRAPAKDQDAKPEPPRAA